MPLGVRYLPSIVLLTRPVSSSQGAQLTNPDRKTLKISPLPSSAVTDLEAHLTTISHRPLCCSYSRDTVIRDQCPRSPRGRRVGAKLGTGAEGGTVRWRMEVDQALEEGVVQARVGLLLVGVKT